MKVWEDLRGDHNLVLKADGFYISYLQPYRMTNTFGWGASDDESIGETALVTKEPWDCKILNGDFRKEYEAVIDFGYDACLNVFKSNSDKQSSWSD